MATTSTQTSERECAVCLEEFTSPKILPCGHLLCQACVICSIDSKPNDGCPICKYPIGKPQVHPDKKSDDIAEALPTDFVMEAMVECVRLLKDPKQCVCGEDAAESLCIQCMDMLCSRCAKAHKNMSMSRNHTVKSLSTVTPDHLAASRPALCADCDHKEPAELFCGHHRRSVCLHCGILKHKACGESLRKLNNELISAKKSMNELIDNLGKAEQDHVKAIEDLDWRVEQVNCSEQEDIAQVDLACDRLQKLVEDFRTNLKEVSRSSHSQVRKSLNDVKNAHSQRLAIVTSHKRIGQRASTVAPCPGLIHVAQALTDRVNNLDLSVHEKENISATLSTVAYFCEDQVGQVEKILRKRKIESKMQPLPSQTASASSTSLTSSKKIMEIAKEYGLFFFNDVLTNGVVIAAFSQLLEPRVFYRVRFDGSKFKGVQPDSHCKMYCGVLGKDPSTCEFQEKKDLDVFGWRDVDREGCVAALMVDAANVLHFYLDGREIEKRTEGVPRPCFAIFKLDPNVKVTILPAVKEVKPADKTGEL